MGHTVGLQRGGVVYNIEEKKRELGEKEREACYLKKVSVGHVMVQVCLFVCLFFFLPIVSNRQFVSVILALFIPHRILALIRFSILFDLL